MNKEKGFLTELRHRRDLNLSSVGKLLLKAEVETNLSIPCALLEIEGHLSKEACVQLLNERLIPKFDRFRSVVTNNGSTFSIYDNFDCNEHVIEKVFEGERYETNQFIRGKISKIKNIAFDPNKPLWEVRLFYFTHTNRTIMFWRVHHCIADGASLGMVFVVIGDKIERKNEQKAPATAAVRRPSKSLFNQLITILKTLILFPLGLIYLLYLWLLYLLPVLLLAKKKLPSIFLNQPSIHKKVGWECVTDLKESKDICEALSKGNVKPTINDIMLSCSIGAIEKYIKNVQSEDNSITSGDSLTVAIPVNVRTAPIKTLGNKVGSYNLSFPLGIPDVVKRSAVITKLMNTRKYVPEPQLINLITYTCSILPQKVMVPLFSSMCARFCLIVSNVRGPSETLYYNSLKVNSLMGFIPPPNGVPIAIGITSYDSKVFVTMNSDLSVISKPSLLMDCFIEEFNTLKESLLTKK